MKRRVVLHGPSTLTISLPTEWVKRHGIHKGDELEVEEAPDGLRISTSREPRPDRHVDIDLDNLSDDAIRSILDVLHKSGYDDIRVKALDEHRLQLVCDSVAKRLIGFEVIEQGQKSCHIRALATDDSQEFDHVLRRAFLVTTSMAKTTWSALDSGDEGKVDEALRLEETNNRLTNFCHRLINKSATKDIHTQFLYVIVWLLESICDEYKFILRLHGRGARSPAGMKAAFDGAAALVESYYALFYKYSDERMDELRTEVNACRALILGCVKDDDDVLGAARIHLMNVVRLIQDAIGSTTGLHH
ncbi:MAG: phosphate uptake regulator PhoU [Nanoarchaeota archaeon]